MILHGQRMVWRLLMRVVTEIGIIVFTTNAFDSDRVNAMGVGCNAYEKETATRTLFMK